MALYLISAQYTVRSRSAASPISDQVRRVFDAAKRDVARHHHHQRGSGGRTLKNGDVILTYRATSSA